MANTTNNPINKAVDTAAAGAPTTAGNPARAANGGVAPPRDAAPGTFNGSFTMLKDRLLGVVRKLTGSA